VPKTFRSRAWKAPAAIGFAARQGCGPPGTSAAAGVRAGGAGDRRVVLPEGWPATRPMAAVHALPPAFARCAWATSWPWHGPLIPGHHRPRHPPRRCPGRRSPSHRLAPRLRRQGCVRPPLVRWAYSAPAATDTHGGQPPAPHPPPPPHRRTGLPPLLVTPTRAAPPPGRGSRPPLDDRRSLPDREDRTRLGPAPTPRWTSRHR